MKVLLFALFNSLCFISYSQIKKSYYSFESLLDMDNKKDSTYYPTLRNNEELKAKIRTVGIYPEVAKKRKIPHTTNFKLTIDTLGNIKNIIIKGEPNLLFDSTATAVMQTTNGLWIPAIRNNKKVETEISTKVDYSIGLKDSNSTMCYMVSIMGVGRIIIDSSKNMPAVLRYKEEKEEKNDTENYSYYFRTRKYNAKNILLAQRYGTVTVGFDVDTNGKLSNIELVNSVSPELDEHALKFIRSSDNQWLPAIKDGIKRESHIEFDTYYYLYSSNTVSIGYQIQANYIDKIEARNFFDEKDYNNALKRLNKSCKYYIHDPEVFLLRGLCHINLQNIEKACEDINYAIYKADEFGYPASMNKEKVTEFLNKYCSLTEKEDVEEK